MTSPERFTSYETTVHDFELRHQTGVIIVQAIAHLLDKRRETVFGRAADDPNLKQDVEHGVLASDAIVYREVECAAPRAKGIGGTVFCKLYNESSYLDPDSTIGEVGFYAMSPQDESVEAYYVLQAPGEALRAYAYRKIDVRADSTYEDGLVAFCDLFTPPDNPDDIDAQLLAVSRTLASL